jgi:hypothetical protein
VTAPAVLRWSIGMRDRARKGDGRTGQIVMRSSSNAVGIRWRAGMSVASS